MKPKSTKPSQDIHSTESRVPFSVAITGKDALPNQQLLAQNKALAKKGKRKRK